MNMVRLPGRLRRRRRIQQAGRADHRRGEYRWARWHLGSPV